MKTKTALSQQERNDLVNVMGTPSGRALIWRLLDVETGFHNSAYTGNAATYYNLGKQDVGRDLYDDIWITCPDSYIQMRREAEQREMVNERKAD
ncbi:MAG: hypothetical protein WC637_17585 [Victivallales bacterium]|jgi:hypothetical protein